MVENVYRNTKMEIWFNMVLMLRKIDVNALEKTHCAHKNSSRNLCVPRD